MRDTIMIVRLGQAEDFEGEIRLPLHLRSVVTERIGEVVLLGMSQAAGIWTLMGEARLVGVGDHKADAVLELNSVQRLTPAVSFVTDGGGQEAPLDLDEMFADEYAAIGASTGEAFLAAAEVQTRFAGAPVVTDPWHAKCLPAGAPEARSFVRAYRRRCAISGMPLVVRHGQREGYVVPIDPAAAAVSGSISDAVPLSGSFAFLFLSGLIGVLPGLRLAFNPALDPAIPAVLRELNPEMRLFAPEDPALWPSASLLRKHLDHWGLGD